MRTEYVDMMAKPSAWATVRVNLINLESPENTNKNRQVKLTLLDEWVKVGVEVKNRDFQKLGKVWQIVNPALPNGQIATQTTSTADLNPNDIPPGFVSGFAHLPMTTYLKPGESKTIYFTTRVVFSVKDGLLIYTEPKTTPSTSCELSNDPFNFVLPDLTKNTCGVSTEENQLCRLTFQYRTRLAVEATDDRGAIIAAMTLIPQVCGAPGANEPVEVQALNGGRPF